MMKNDANKRRYVILVSELIFETNMVSVILMILVSRANSKRCSEGSSCGLPDPLLSPFPPVLKYLKGTACVGCLHAAKGDRKLVAPAAQPTCLPSPYMAQLLAEPFFTILHYLPCGPATCLSGDPSFTSLLVQKPCYRASIGLPWPVTGRNGSFVGQSSPPGPVRDSLAFPQPVAGQNAESLSPIQPSQACFDAS
ncbi:hypothetical protein E2320_001965 [Naja naja]|nr:hypothetical protein E2320_001965 [Naja naja]